MARWVSSIAVSNPKLRSMMGISFVVDLGIRHRAISSFLRLIYACSMWHRAMLPIPPMTYSWLILFSMSLSIISDGFSSDR